MNIDDTHITKERSAANPPTTISRRSLLGLLGGGTIGTAIGLSTSASTGNAKEGGAPSDFDILNLALNLEYLESEFYTYALTGQGIEALGITTDGLANLAKRPTAGNLSSPIRFYSAQQKSSLSMSNSTLSFCEVCSAKKRWQNLPWT